MEGVDAGLKTQLKEAATALLGRSLNIKSGETFRLSWSNLGHGSCDIGPLRERVKGSPHSHVNLLDIPADVNSPELTLQLAEGGWVNVENRGKKPLAIKLQNTDEERFRYVYTKDFKPKSAVNGVAVLEPGEMISTKQEGNSFMAEWETQDQKVVLSMRGISMTLPVGTETGLAIAYKREDK